MQLDELEKDVRYDLQYAHIVQISYIRLNWFL